MSEVFITMDPSEKAALNEAITRNRRLEEQVLTDEDYRWAKMFASEILHTWQQRGFPNLLEEIEQSLVHTIKYGRGAK